ncbi:MAG: DUF5700 domain-containing putative Zn-dependent protease [Bacteroidota bacterium]
MRKSLPFASILVLFILFSCTKKDNSPSFVCNYDFAQLAIEYFETGDTILIEKIAGTGGAKHIFNHAKQFSREDFDYGLPLKSRYDMIKALLSPFEEKKQFLPGYKKALTYAKDSVENTGIVSRIVMEYLPADFTFRDSTFLFFTIGYDLGVSFDGNSSLNLAHSHYLKNLKEIKFYSIHEMHHAGFLQVKNSSLPSIDFKNHAEVKSFIEYFTQLEGMATYAAYGIRKVEKELHTDKDYIALQNDSLMNKLEQEYFKIYGHFSENPDASVTKEDWELIFQLSGKRLWYRVGARIAEDIDSIHGREYLTNLIRANPARFIEEYLSLKNISG